LRGLSRLAPWWSWATDTPAEGRQAGLETPFASGGTPVRQKVDTTRYGVVLGRATNAPSELLDLVDQKRTRQRHPRGRRLARRQRLPHGPSDRAAPVGAMLFL
jgi:hypothetical protein